jgi:hypothetical protein
VTVSDSSQEVLEMGTDISGSAVYTLYLGEGVTQSQKFFKFDDDLGRKELCYLSVREYKKAVEIWSGDPVGEK